MLDQDKAIRLGHPSYVWRFGQDRRLDLIRDAVPVEGAFILDIGCGVGAYVEKFRALTAVAFGVDLDVMKLAAARSEKGLETLAACQSERLPFPADIFDAVLLNEVIEHVDDDAQTIREAHRVLKPGGVILVFAPNRYFPFETHGAFWGGHYIFGNIPLIGYLPDKIRARFAPHVRAYRTRELQRLFTGLDGAILRHTQIYPGYDKIARRSPLLAQILRRVTFALESTRLRFFGLSHYLIWEKGHRT